MSAPAASRKVAELLSARAFIAVRHSDGRDWIDTATMSGSREAVEEKIDRAALALPGWAKANPVARVAAFRVVEAES